MGTGGGARRLVGTAVALALVLVTGVATVLVRLPRPPAVPVAGLLPVAEAAMRARNDYLVGGETDRADAARRSPAFGAWFARRVESTYAGQHAAVTSAGIRYVGSFTAFSDVSTKADRDRATLVADVETALRTVATSGGAPPYTRSNERMTFSFAAIDGSWVLRDVRGESLGMALRSAGPVPAPPSASV